MNEYGRREVEAKKGQEENEKRWECEVGNVENLMRGVVIAKGEEGESDCDGMEDLEIRTWRGRRKAR